MVKIIKRVSCYLALWWAIVTYEIKIFQDQNLGKIGNVMHDIKLIRKDPEWFDAQMKKRSLEPQSQKILTVDEECRALKTSSQTLLAERNSLSSQMAQIKKSGDENKFEEVAGKVRHLKEEIARQEQELSSKETCLKDMLSSLPNVMSDDVPLGADEEDNKEIKVWGEKPTFSFDAKAHYDLGEALGMMDFEEASKMSGTRFVVLKKDLARLERSLATFMLDLHTKEHGYEEVSPPVLVKSHSLFGTGQLPKFAEDSFSTQHDLWLIPTSEVPLTNLVRESILAEKELPKRFTANTLCFRSEAGAAGRDTRGMIRQHQFSKVELVSVVSPEEGERELDRMIACVEKVLQKLNLHYRIMLLCSGDTGFSSHKTYDFEVWFPEQKVFREISSCSWMGAFQARRMQARYKNSEKGTHFVHTLNGSGLAVGRALAAVLENYQTEQGSVVVPDVLRPYMGQAVIESMT